MRTNRLFVFFMTACLALAAMASSHANNSKDMNSNNKTLVAYFSATGTTMEAATRLAKAANADLFVSTKKW